MILTFYKTNVTYSTLFSCSSEYSCASFHLLDTVSLKICTVPSEETSSAKTLVLIKEWPSILDPQYLCNTEGTKNIPYSWQLLLRVWWVHATTSITCKSNPIPRASNQSCQLHCNFSGRSLVLHSSQSPMLSSVVLCPYCIRAHINPLTTVHLLWICWFLLLIGMIHGKECNPCLCYCPDAWHV